MSRFLHSKTMRRACAIALLACLVATAVLVFDGLHDRLGRADVGLVLGSKVEPDGAPSTRLRARLDRTVELYKDAFFPVVIASGGLGKEGFDEAAVMRDYLVAHGVPQDRIIVDSAGADTFLSAHNARDIARTRGFRSVLVVSQYFHLPRARLAVARFGFFPVYSAHARYFELRDLYSTPRELAGYVKYLLRAYPASRPQR
jgi:vancomycin permeability regulator SanA